MALFWNKTIEPTRVIYTRSRQAKERAYVVLGIGLILMIGTPSLIGMSGTFRSLSSDWATPFIFLIALGIGLIVFVAIFTSVVNFKIMVARLMKKSVVVTSTESGDTVMIQR